MATITMSQLASNVKAVHTGVVCVASALSLTTTLTVASSPILLCRVPHGATLLDWWFKLATGGVGQTVQLGTSNSPSGIMAITTLSVTFSESAVTTSPTDYGVMGQGWLRCPGGTRGNFTGLTADLMPVRISLSDDVQPSEIFLRAELSVDISASAWFTWCLFYTMDGLIGHTTIR